MNRGTPGGKDLICLVSTILASHDDSLSWGVFENVGGDAVQIQLRREGRRESLILEEVQNRGISTDATAKTTEWIAQTLSNPSFGSAPNIAVYSWDGQRVP